MPPFALRRRRRALARIDSRGVTSSALACSTLHRAQEASCEVALDDNLREEIMRIPYFVAPTAHADLLEALWEDTAFLSRLGIMDYSLLVSPGLGSCVPPWQGERCRGQALPWAGAHSWREGEDSGAVKEGVVFLRASTANQPPTNRLLFRWAWTTRTSCWPWP